MNRQRERGVQGSVDRQYDVVVVGAGLGGLLAAAAVVKTGGSVLVLERLPYIGGRFTTVKQEGYEITTGALHMVPHGRGGVLAQALRDLGIPFRPVRRDVYASFVVGGRHIIWKRPFDILKLFNSRGRLDLISILLKMTLRRRSPRSMTFRDWLVSTTTRVHAA